MRNANNITYTTLIYNMRHMNNQSLQRANPQIITFLYGCVFVCVHFGEVFCICYVDIASFFLWVCCIVIFLCGRGQYFTTVRSIKDDQGTFLGWVVPRYFSGLRIFVLSLGGEVLKAFSWLLGTNERTIVRMAGSWVFLRKSKTNPSQFIKPPFLFLMASEVGVLTLVPEDNIRPSRLGETTLHWVDWVSIYLGWAWLLEHEYLWIWNPDHQSVCAQSGRDLTVRGIKDGGPCALAQVRL